MLTSITIETTNYSTWPELRALVELVLSARMDTAPVDGVERIGLRYTDEIRIPGEGEPKWGEWINESLMPPRPNTLSARLSLVQQQSTLLFSADEPGASITLRYGALNGSSTASSSLLARPNAPESGPFFLIDTDAAWVPLPGEEVPALDPATVASKSDVLHALAKELFEAALTDRLRAEVLNVG